jgi:hypothetical protein
MHYPAGHEEGPQNTRKTGGGEVIARYIQRVAAKQGYAKRAAAKEAAVTGTGSGRRLRRQLQKMGGGESGGRYAVTQIGRLRSGRPSHKEGGGRRGGPYRKRAVAKAAVTERTAPQLVGRYNALAGGRAPQHLHPGVIPVL